MPTFDLFSKRQKRIRGQVPDVYRYDEIPQGLRVQIVQIWGDALGGQKEYYNRYGSDGPRRAYELITQALCREYGIFRLVDGANDHYGELANFLLQEEDVDRVLDAIELSFRFIDRSTRNFEYMGKPRSNEAAISAIEELNERFREHGIGFAYQAGQIIRIDSQFIHHEVVKPALAVFAEPIFRGAQDEFLAAHEHYKKGENKEAMNCALKSFESVLKSICDSKGWPYDKDKATAKALLEICFERELIPNFWQSTMGGLRSILENAVPTARNRVSAHGQGGEVIEVPPHLAAFVLHATAACAVFLASAAGAESWGSV
jgi:hypothetical protein